MKNTGGWLCMNCLDHRGVPGKIIDSEDPVCECGINGNDEQYRKYVMPREVIHFDAPHAFLKEKGVGHYACDPKKTSFGNGQCTGHVDAVTCMKCKGTHAFKGTIEIQSSEVVNTADREV